MRFIAFLCLLLVAAAAGAQVSYKGPLKDGKYHGQGRAELANGEIYEGEFRNGEFTGEGTANLPDGTRYRGQFLNWKPHGKGRLVDGKGNIYEGEFKDGLFDGEGTLRLKSGPVRSGKWKQGKPDDSAELARAADETELALYRQRPLLDEALAALQPRQPGRVNLYVLVVAGDGSQEVFRREAEFVRSQFDALLGTRGRSVLLVNSRNTTGSAPMATRTSIREALKALAAKMDRNEDVLFVYFTSHGTKDQHLVLQHNSLVLRSLAPADLAALLKESGIRWKAIVVSACYAGSFVPPLRDERTLVIAAAAADRQSFGCVDENDFTYFGRAFFKEALPASKSFDEAFGRARALVDQWEKRDNKSEAERSQPQIHSPKPVSEHLQKWWRQARP